MNKLICYEGTLKLIIKTQNDELFDYMCRDIVLKHILDDDIISEYLDNWQMIIQYELQDTYMIIIGKHNKYIYEVLNKNVLEPDNNSELFYIKELVDDIYNFRVCYNPSHFGFDAAIEKSFNVRKNYKYIISNREQSSKNLIKFINSLFRIS